MKKAIAITSAAALILSASPAFARGGVLVSNSNESAVIVHVLTGANSGSNTADGGAGGNSGRGGSVLASDDDNAGGNGGNAGRGGNGGAVTTGSAISTTVVRVEAGSNRTIVEGCGCENEDEDEGRRDSVRVRNYNGSVVAVGGATLANSGKNAADGGEGGESGKGGSVVFSDDDNIGGNAGRGGDAGNGGAVVTGPADSLTNVAVVTGRNVTRVRR